MLAVVTPTSVQGKTARKTRPRGLLYIGLFKLIKGLLLVSVGIGAASLLHKDLGEVFMRWVQVLRVDPDNQFIHRILVKLFAVTPRQLEELSIGTFFYAALLLTEGVGLLLAKHWAEYFTVITTAALIPLELFELAKHVTAVKLLVLAVNVGIVWYLVARLRTEKKER